MDASCRRVRFIECDPQGRVNNAYFLAWIDDALHEWLADMDDLYGRLHADGSTYVLAAARLDYRGAVRFDDRIEILVVPRAVGTTSLTMQYRIHRCGETDVLFEAEARYVCIGPDERPAPWPDVLRHHVSRHAETARG